MRNFQLRRDEGDSGPINRPGNGLGGMREEKSLYRGQNCLGQKESVSGPTTSSPQSLADRQCAWCKLNRHC